ncbi:transposase [uncultured Ruminococcus sp.]|uniref:transposase n=1 Tax=uncultured Ruminococcus sp. TaxID=165186 RepID=UPI00260AAAA4|nr:transposase [uncultured Ruminococcus sp.]
MSKKREYDEKYKVQAVKLAKNLGSAKAAAEELQIPVNTLYGWIQKVKTAELDIGCGERSPEEALSIAKENQQLFFYYTTSLSDNTADCHSYFIL